MARRKVEAATALVFALGFAAPACGGTLEGKYRRGELTTTTTVTTTPTGGNAAGERGAGERRASGAGGTIARSATGRIVLPPLGGRHR